MIGASSGASLAAVVAHLHPLPPIPGGDDPRSSLAMAGTVLAASLLGSPHCAGMCGGFVAFYSGHAARGSRGLAHAAYSVGRLASYVTLGALAGALGLGLDRAGALAGVARGAALASGALMVAWGGLTLLELRDARLFHRAPTFLVRPLGGAMRAVREQPAPIRGLVVGLLTTLLPCGWLYAFVAVAAGSGSPVTGAAVMGLFWLGTLPVMTALGLAVQHVAGPLRHRIPALTAALLVVLGLFTIAGKFHPMHALAAGASANHECR